MKYSKVHITSFGYELPPNVVSSEDLEKRLAPLYDALHFQKGQLESLTGIRERRFWDPGFRMAQGAILAGEKSIAAAGIDPQAIRMLVYGGVCRDNLEPATACAVSNGLGLGPDTLVYDVSNACLGILNGMVQVANAIELGQISAGLVVSCESAREIVDSTIQRMLEAGPSSMTLSRATPRSNPMMANQRKRINHWSRLSMEALEKAGVSGNSDIISNPLGKFHIELS